MGDTIQVASGYLYRGSEDAPLYEEDFEGFSLGVIDTVSSGAWYSHNGGGSGMQVQQPAVPGDKILTAANPGGVMVFAGPTPETLTLDNELPIVIQYKMAALVSAVSEITCFPFRAHGANDGVAAKYNTLPCIRHAYSPNAVIEVGDFHGSSSSGTPLVNATTVLLDEFTDPSDASDPATVRIEIAKSGTSGIYDLFNIIVKINGFIMIAIADVQVPTSLVSINRPIGFQIYSGTATTTRHINDIKVWGTDGS